MGQKHWKRGHEIPLTKFYFDLLALPVERSKFFFIFFRLVPADRTLVPDEISIVFHSFIKLRELHFAVHF